MVIWLIGLSAAGKTTFGKLMYETWKQKASNTVFIDAEDVRRIFGHNQDQSAYTIEERKKNADRICRICQWLDAQGMNVVCATIGHFEESREWNRKNYSKYFEVFIDVPMDILMKRETKGLYAKTKRGEMKNVVGIDIPFIPPKNSNYIFDNSKDSIFFKKIANEILSRALKL